MSVSADVVVAEDDATARELASRLRAVGAQHPHRRRAPSRSPRPAEAAAHAWTDEDRELVADRIDTQFVGSPAARRRPAARRCADATGADELLITTITHDHADRVRSYELLAEGVAGLIRLG